MTTPVAARPSLRPRRLARSIAAVLGAILANIVLSLATDQLLRVLGVFPPVSQPMSNALFALATAYRLAYGVGSGYLAARLAPDRPMAHVTVLGILGVIGSLGGVIVARSHPELGPMWYPVVLLVFAFPCAWLGGKLHRSTL